jgi:hypothetical protein
MGTIKQGILGGFSGKVGPTVGSSWKGIAVIKSKPLSVANPNTAGQQAQRGALSQIVIVARLLLSNLIQTYWNPFAQRMSGYNSFVSENIAQFDATGLVTPAGFYSQRGSLLGQSVGNATAGAGANGIVIPWVNNAGQSDALATDEAVITIYNETQNYWLVDAGNAVRSAATRTVTDAVMAQADVLHIYLGFSRPDVSKVSDSAYKTINVGA